MINGYNHKPAELVPEACRKSTSEGAGTTFYSPTVKENEIHYCTAAYPGHLKAFYRPYDTAVIVVLNQKNTKRVIYPFDISSLSSHFDFHVPTYVGDRTAPLEHEYSLIEILHQLFVDDPPIMIVFRPGQIFRTWDAAELLDGKIESLFNQMPTTPLECRVYKHMYESKEKTGRPNTVPPSIAVLDIPVGPGKQPILLDDLPLDAIHLFRESS